MAYVTPNFSTKKQLMAAVKAGSRVRLFYPGIPGPTSGKIAIEGPHYPQPHTWYANVVAVNGAVVKVIS